MAMGHRTKSHSFISITHVLPLILTLLLFNLNLSGAKAPYRGSATTNTTNYRLDLSSVELEAGQSWEEALSNPIHNLAYLVVTNRGPACQSTKPAGCTHYPTQGISARECRAYDRCRFGR